MTLNARHQCIQNGTHTARHQCIQNGTHLAKKYRGGVQNAPKLAILMKNLNSDLIGIIFISFR